MIDGDQPAFLAALIGAGIAGSLTPAMHEREGAAQGLRTVYRLIDLARLGLGTEALPDLLTAASRLSFTGLNITHPCKQWVVPLLDALSDEARMLGAVNTVVLRDGERVGHNTDGWGFAEARRCYERAPSARSRHSGTPLGHSSSVSRQTSAPISSARWLFPVSVSALRGRCPRPA